MILATQACVQGSACVCVNVHVYVRGPVCGCVHELCGHACMCGRMCVCETQSRVTPRVPAHEGRRESLNVFLRISSSGRRRAPLCWSLRRQTCAPELRPTDPTWSPLRSLLLPRPHRSAAKRCGLNSGRCNPSDSGSQFGLPAPCEDSDLPKGMKLPPVSILTSVTVRLGL